MEKVTIKMIAQKCNVSVGTVDRALNGRGRISPETEKKVLEMAEKLNYQRNQLASALGKHRSYRIAVLSPRMPEGFFSFVEKGIRDAQKEMLDYSIHIDQFHTNFLNYEEQREVLKTINKDRYDGLVLTASSERLAEQINKKVDVGLPVVTFNSDLKDSKRLFFVGEDAYKSGRLCGSQMGGLLQGKGRVASVVSYLTPGSSVDRLNGFRDALRSKYPDIEILEPCESYEREENATQIVGDLLKKYGRINGIFANSASSTTGIGRYFAENAVSEKPVLIGYDVTPEVGGYLKTGIFDMVIDQNPQKQSYYGLTLMGKHLMDNWRPQSSRLSLRVKLVMQDNVDDFCEEFNQDNHILL